MKSFKLTYALTLLFTGVFLPDSLATDKVPSKSVRNDLEQGNFFIKHYKRDFLNSVYANWTLIQDQDGIIYVGNTIKGVIEFDGQRVKRIIKNKVPMNAFVREMGMDSRNTIYVGTGNNFGYLQKNKFGDQEYISLSDELPKKDELTSTFWGLCVHHDTTFFQTEDAVYLYRYKKFLRVFKFKETVHVLNETPNGVFLRVWGKGLMRFNKDKGFQLIPGTAKIFAQNRVDALYLLQSGDHLLVSRNVGFYLLKKNGTVEKVQNPFINQYVIEGHSYMGSSVMKNGKIPVITSDRGILFLNQDLSLNAEIGVKSGLHEEGFSYYIQDRAGDIWGANSGITKISFDPSLTNFSSINGLKGGVSDIKRIGGVLYVRTSDDLFRFNPKKSVADLSTFTSMGITELGGRFIPFGDQIVNTNNYTINAIYKGKKIHVSSLYRSNHSIQANLNPNLLYTSNSAYGLLLHEFRNGKWDSVKVKNGETYSGNNLKEISPGKILISTRKGMVEFAYTKSGQGIFTPYKPDKLFTQKKDFTFLEIRENLTVCLDSANRVYLPDVQKHMLRHTSFSLDSMVAGEVWTYEYNPEAGYGWLLCKNGLFKTKFDLKKGFSFQKYPLYKVDLSELSYRIMVEGKGEHEVIWLGSQENKIYRYLPELAIKEKIPQFKALIRRISSGNEPVELEPGTLAFDKNNLVFEVAYPLFGTENKTTFSYWLENQDETWSDFGSDSKKEYTNLHEGTYTFHVRAKDATGHISEEAKVSFRISPPWYRTIVAYIIYLAILIYLFILFGRYQAKKSRGKAEDERRMAELEAAKDLQNRMLPKQLPQNLGLDIATYLQTSSEVGGDYYDFHPQPDGTLIAVCGDATGHGTAAGMLVSITKAGLIGLPLDEPQQMLFDLNRLVKKVDLGILRMSLNIVHVKGDSLVLSSAAMPPCYLYSAKSNTVEEIQLSGLPLGGLYGATFDQVERPFEEGDLFVIVSDGLPEAPNLKGVQLGYQAVEECILQHANKTSNEIKEALVQLGHTWLAGQITPDDITIVIIKKTK